MGKIEQEPDQGLQFRRQHPINAFIVDFYCAKIKLVIEIDGSIHDIPEYHLHDVGRSAMLEDFGFTVIRFTNEQIMNEIDYTVEQIEIIVQKLLNI